MRITEIRTQAVCIPYKKPWVISGGPTSVAANVLVEITVDNGISGIGEACPVPAYSYETQVSVSDVIEHFLAPMLIGQDPFDAEKIESMMATAIHGNHFAKAAIDIALHDLRAKILGLQVCDLIGGHYREEIPLIRSICLGSTEERVAEAIEFTQLGIKEIKLKVGANPALDLEQVKAVREAVGPSVKIRIDANQGYRLSEAIPHLKKLERYDLRYIEQPLPRWDIAGMATLAQALDTPIMADESVVTPEETMTLIRHRAVDIVNIKVMKCGISGGKKIAEIAEAAGIPCMVGSMVELGVGTAAGIQFACATRNVTYACEISGPTKMKDDVIEGNPFSAWPSNHSWKLPEGPGLGVTLKREILGKLAPVSHHLDQNAN